MGIKERRDSEKAGLKKKIMDAAIEIISQEGYANLSIRKIAARIEYSPTTIYLYYKDKAQIITDMAEELYDRIRDSAVAIINQDASVSLDNKIRDIMRCFIKTLSDEPEMAKTIMYNGMSEIFSNDERAPYPTNPGIKMLDELFAQGIEEHLLNPNIKNTSWMMLSALMGFAMSVVENQMYLLDQYDQIVDQFVEILMGGMKL